MKTKAILQQVKRTYTTIAGEFDATRNHSWPEFDEFLKWYMSSPRRRGSDRFPIRSGMTLLDVGCGNGRLLDFLALRQVQGDLPAFTYIGVDNNLTLIRIAKKKHSNGRFKIADATSLPFSPHTFDAVWCIAVLHHLPTKKSRLKALKNMRRVLKKCGVLFLTVWNLRIQQKYKKYIDPKTHDGFIPWGVAQKEKRYYHAFSFVELSNILKKAGFLKIKKIKSRYNIALIAYKL